MTEPLKRLQIKAIIDDTELLTSASALEAMIEGIDEAVARGGKTTINPRSLEAMRMTVGRFREIARLAKNGGELSAGGFYSIAALVQDTARGQVGISGIEDAQAKTFDEWFEWSNRNKWSPERDANDRKSAMAWAWTAAVEQVCRALQIRGDEPRRLQCYFGADGEYMSGGLRGDEDESAIFDYDDRPTFETLTNPDSE